MNAITYRLINPDSRIGFKLMELVAIDNGMFWFKCHYEVKFGSVVHAEADLIGFDEQELEMINQDYKIVP